MEGASQPRAESAEQAEVRNLMAALTNTLTAEEMQAFNNIGEPGISEEERQQRIAAFNALKAGEKAEGEVLADDVFNEVPVNLSGKIVKVSRNMRGQVSIAEVY
ncbi:hypothetical protein KJ848_00510 [Patescibacteria group bacterium]|nr:hypothetical protein [Patescibacteria group bacterium]